MDDKRYIFSNINMHGRVCYLIMCIEKYLVNLWPEKDWSVVLERLWPWVISNDWSAARQLSDMVVPEFILEQPDYEKTNAVYDGKLSKELYDKLLELFDGITSGDPDDEINIVIGSLGEFGNSCENTSFSGADQPVTELLERIIEILEQHSIVPPEVEVLADKSVNEAGGWGTPFDGKAIK